VATTSDTGDAPNRLPIHARIEKRVVSARTIATVRAIAEAIFCTRIGPPEAARLDWIADELEDFLGRVGPDARFVYSLLVAVTARMAPLFVGRVTRLDRLPLGDRIRALDAMERRFGEPLLAVKAILCLVYYEHPDAAREVGFDGQCRLPRAPSEASP
jgi:hypothetical protein